MEGGELKDDLPLAEPWMDLDILDVGMMSKWTLKVQRNRLTGVF